MSQELLFLLFMIFEGVFLIALYQFYLVPKVISPAVVEHWLSEIESGRINLPEVLHGYTGELIQQVDMLFFGFPDPDNLDKNGNPKHKKGKLQLYFRDLMGGYMSGGIKQLKADPDNAIAVATSEYLEELPLPAQLVARSLLPKLQAVLTKAPPEVKEAIVEYSPGLSKQ